MHTQFSIAAAVGVLTLLSAVPATGQLSVQVGPYGSRGATVYGRQPVRELIVRPYDSYRHGDYRRTGRDWRPVTVYALGNRYYHQPYRNARPVVVYTYRDNYFLEPRDRGWPQYRTRYQQRDWRSDRRYDDDDDRYERRDGRYESRERYERERYEKARKDRERYEKAREKAREKEAKERAKRNNGRGNGRW